MIQITWVQLIVTIAIGVIPLLIYFLGVKKTRRKNMWDVINSKASREELKQFSDNRKDDIKEIKNGMRDIDAKIQAQTDRIMDLITEIRK